MHAYSVAIPVIYFTWKTHITNTHTAHTYIHIDTHLMFSSTPLMCSLLTVDEGANRTIGGVCAAYTVAVGIVAANKDR